MRRRIYIAPDGSGLQDVTQQASRYKLDREDPLGALYDEPLWAAYVAAREAFDALEGAVIGRLRGEPYDDVERKAAEESDALLDDYEMPSSIKMPKLDEISARILAHAEDIYGNGDAPR